MLEILPDTSSHCFEGIFPPPPVETAALSKWALCDAAGLDHTHSKKYATPALFSLLLTPDLLLKNNIKSAAFSLMTCYHSAFLHNAGRAWERERQAPQTSKGIEADGESLHHFPKADRRDIFPCRMYREVQHI